MKFKKVFDAEVSANRQYVVKAPYGAFVPAKTFGGRHSRSGATLWPEWVQEGAIAIKPLCLLTEQDIDGEEFVVTFSGGGYQSVRILAASPWAIKAALDSWRYWRGGEQADTCMLHATDDGAAEAPPKRSRLPRLPAPEPEVLTDAEWIARAISFNESCNVEGRRLTTHEVSRYAQNLSMEWDEGSGEFRWTATMKLWPMMATALGAEPTAWWLYEAEPQEPVVEGFVEEDE